MRKFPAALVVLGLAAAALTGCAATGAAPCDRPAVSDPETMGLISVSGALDEQPEVDMYTPLRAAQTSWADLEAGDGTAITSDGQLIVLDVSLFSGDDGASLVSTPYDGSLTNVYPLSRWQQQFPGIADALQCATEGTRVAIALAPGDIESETAASLGLTEDSSAVAVVDVRKVYLARAAGTLQFNSGNGLPSVVRAPDGRPGVIVPDGQPPAELVTQTLIKGDGEVITGDQPIRVHYTGVTWADREVFQTTWDDTPVSLTLDGIVKGLATALEGQTVGSQIMVVVPPAEGYGDQAQGSIPAGSTLVFVVDILGLDASSGS